MSKIYFILDAHLGAPNLNRPPRVQEDAMIDFLRAIRNDAEALYIVGDLFDFWFEYRSVIPAHGARVLFELHNLNQSGVRIIYIPGNHDIWLGHYLAKQVGVELPGHEVDVTHQGQRLYLAHGDGFRNDWKFKFSRKILNHPLCITLFRWLHPDIGSKLAHMMSRYSEFRVKKGDLNKIKTGAQIYIKAAAEKFARGFDIVICGHYHRLINEPIESGTLVVLGDWMKYDSYAVLENGNISLKQWHTAPVIPKQG